MFSPPSVEPLRLTRVPLLAALFAFALGIVFARQPHRTLHLAAATLALTALLFLASRLTPRLTWLPALALWTAAGTWCAQIQPAPPRQLELQSFADGLSRTVRGRVIRLHSIPPLPTDDTALAQPPAEPWLQDPGAWDPLTSSEASASPKTPTTQLDLSVDAIEDLTPDVSTLRPVTGGLRLTLLGPPPPLACGEILQLPVRLRVPDTYRDPGAFDSRAWLLAEGIGVHASAPAAQITPLGRTRPTLACRFAAAQNWSIRRLDAIPAAMRSWPAPLRLTPADTAILSATLFGDRSALSRDLRGSFERTGTFHLFVVSGIHVALLAAALLWTFRRLRVPLLIGTPVTLVLLTAYAALTGFGTPVHRALGMTAAYLLAGLFARTSNPLNALGFAALLLLAVNPQVLWQASFQMTFLVVFAAAGLASPIAQRTWAPWLRAARDLPHLRRDAWLHPRFGQFRVTLRLFSEILARQGARRLARIASHLPTTLVRSGGWFADMLLFSFSIELCMVLPMALWFHRLTLLALPTNLIAVPLVSALLAGAILTFLTALLSSHLAAVPAALTAVILHLMRTAITHIGRPATLADLRVPTPANLAILCAVAALLLACWSLRRPTRALFTTGCLAALAAPAFILWPRAPQFHPNRLEVTALDVGQGDSLLVVSPQGGTLLVDAGGPVGGAALSPHALAPGVAPVTTTRWDVGEEVVAPYLWSRRIRRLDAVALTHAHSDHMGGLPSILRDFRPRELWLGPEPARSEALRSLLAEAATLGITVRHLHAGDAFSWHGLQTTVLAPEALYTNPGTPANNDSLVLRLDFARASALLEGDAEAPSEAAMLASARVEPVTLLKVAHHGSRTSTTGAFLAAARPQDAVISVGRHNTFGHPRFEVLDRLESAHIHTFRTDRNGAETFLLSPDGGISATPAASNP